MTTINDPTSTPVDSHEKWEERTRADNEGKSRLMYEVLADDDKAWGCKVLVLPGGPADICAKVSFFRAKEGQYKGQELCLEHAYEMGDKCCVDECPYEGNELHMDVPWDYTCNAPAIDTDGEEFCHFHATQDRTDYNDE